MVGSDLIYADPAFFYPGLLLYIWNMIHAEHLIIREIKTWRSYGIHGTDPPIDTLIKDIGDEHLLNIIKHLEDLHSASDLRFLPAIWETMHDEVVWRMQGCWQAIEIPPDVPNRVF